MQTLESLLGSGFSAGADPLCSTRTNWADRLQDSGVIHPAKLDFLNHSEDVGAFLEDFDFPPVFSTADLFLHDVLENFLVFHHFAHPLGC